MNALYKHDLAEHALQEHGILPGIDMPKCKFCGKTFLYKPDLEIHEQIHSRPENLVSMDHFVDSMLSVSEAAVLSVLNSMKAAEDVIPNPEIDNLENANPEIANPEIHNLEIPEISVKKEAAAPVTDSNDMSIADSFSLPSSAATVNDQTQNYCEICSKSFCSKNYFQRHFSKHDHIHKTAMWNRKVCEVCNLDFTSVTRVSNLRVNCLVCDLVLEQTDDSKPERIMNKLRLHLKGAKHLRNQEFFEENGNVRLDVPTRGPNSRGPNSRGPYAKTLEKRKKARENFDHKPKRVKRMDYEELASNHLDSDDVEIWGFEQNSDSSKYDENLQKPFKTRRFRPVISLEQTLEEIAFIQEIPYFTELPESPAAATICQICDAKLKSTTSLEVHETKHKHVHMLHHDLNQECPMCFETDVPRGLCRCKREACRVCRIISKLPIEPEFFECLVCESSPKIFNNTWGFNNHLKSHKHVHMLALTEQRDCERCGISWDNQINLPKLCHCKSNHCLVCKLLKKSAEEEVSAADSFCEICFKVPHIFSHKTDYQLHVNKHKHHHMRAYLNSRDTANDDKTATQNTPKNDTASSTCSHHKCLQTLTFNDKKSFPRRLCQCKLENCRICETIIQRVQKFVSDCQNQKICPARKGVKACPLPSLPP